jgi:hypothetical protein
MVPLVTALLFSAPDLPTHREGRVSFAVDEAFQARGGLQYWFALQSGVSRELAPLARGLGPATHVVMSRIVHTLNKPACFFSAERVLDIDYINTIGPVFQVTAKGPGQFHAARTPANDFTVRHFDRKALEARVEDPAFRQLEALCGAAPDSVVVQHNSDFARILGWRTAEGSFTWTAHYALGPQRTRVCVVTMSALVNLPPFFLGGKGRLHDESVREAVALVRALRQYDDPPCGATR